MARRLLRLGMGCWLVGSRLGLGLRLGMGTWIRLGMGLAVLGMGRLLGSLLVQPILV